MLRFMGLLVVVGVLGGCVTTGSPTAEPPTGAVGIAEKLRTQQRGVVIVHTSMHDYGCRPITAVLARPNEVGQFEIGQTVVLRHTLAFTKTPAAVELPAGEYGFVQLRCQQGRDVTTFNARVAKQGSLFNGPKTTYVAPIAKFNVQAGEVVDIGSLRLPTRQVGEAKLFEMPKHVFTPVITPIPDEWLKKLAEAEPELYQARIVRPMTGAIKI